MSVTLSKGPRIAHFTLGRSVCLKSVTLAVGFSGVEVTAVRRDGKIRVERMYNGWDAAFAMITRIEAPYMTDVSVTAL